MIVRFSYFQQGEKTKPKAIMDERLKKMSKLIGRSILLVLSITQELHRFVDVIDFVSYVG